MTRDHVAQFHTAWFKANHATMVVVGDTTTEEIASLLNQYFGSWKRGRIREGSRLSLENHEARSFFLQQDSINPALVSRMAEEASMSARGVACKSRKWSEDRAMETIPNGLFRETNG